MARIVIVGAGQAAAQAATSLRQEGWSGDILMFGDERFLPYQRPPLSKGYLAGTESLDRILLRPETFYRDQHIVVRTDTRIAAIHPTDRLILAEGGEIVRYDKLLLATGARPRHLPVSGHDLDGIHYLRSIDQVDRLRAELLPGRRLVLVGGGYIGLEVAATAIQAGLEVDVLEMEARILNRVTGPEMSAYYHRLHESHGVRLHRGVAVTAFRGNGRVEAAIVGDSEIPADLVVVGVGVLPNVELARHAGLACDDGIVVDERCRTSHSDIYAAGDCSNHPNPILGRRLRLESVPNAIEQARVAATNMSGGEKSYASMPWFWSDQYGLKLQMAGFSDNRDVRVLRGDMAENRFALFYLRDGIVSAVDAVGSLREFGAYRQLLGKPVDAGALADTDIDVKSLSAQTSDAASDH